MTHTSNERHQDLIANKEALFRAVSLAVLAIAPSATSIWCFGLNVGFWGFSRHRLQFAL